MNNDLKFMGYKTILLSSLLAASVAFAQEEVKDTTSVESRQLSLLEKLTNYEANAIGFAINGNAKAGYLHSSISSDALTDDSQLSEASAYTRMNMVFSVRPSSESVARFDLRFHKDWQNAHREGNNSPITTWWSYDGYGVNKHMKFNLGHMRVAYTPLTVYQPMPDFIFEPTILAEHRQEVMADKNLDGSNGRLMQGANVEVTTGKLGALDDLKFHGTLARIRNVGKKTGQVFFDFDNSDRYLTGIAGSVDLAGITLGVNDVYTFDRVRSSRTINMFVNADTLYYDRNNVLSFELGFDSKRLMPGKFHFGANVEYALSYWSYIRDAFVQTESQLMVVDTSAYVNSEGELLTDRGYFSYKTTTESNPEMNQVAAAHNKGALLVDLFADATIGSIDFDAKAHGVMVDKDYQAEQAMTPAVLSNIPVLNSDASFAPSALDVLLSGVRSGSLENLYFTMYESVPLNSSNMMLTDPSKYESEFYRLYNNYKYAQYYRNGYNNVTLKRAELLGTTTVLDPSTNIALPYGYATPNRKGGDIDLNGKWNDAVALRVVFGFYNADKYDPMTDSIMFVTGTQYMRAGGGVNVDVARLANLAKDFGVKLGGSFEMTKEKEGLERSSSRIMAGLDLSWKQLSLLTGFQMLSLDFGNPYLGILDKSSEMLLLTGLRYKLGAGAYATVEYGRMKNTIDFRDMAAQAASLDISKNIIMADVTVNF
ncbi:hypothetical protein [Fibrobacter sp.]|uniref:hypothetical protein n=1 Tax=Fibrobacter sp. TaxID=35828 RepID=UPI00386FE030